MKSFKLLPVVFALWILAGASGSVQAQGTAFTYQGRLNAGGAATSGNYDLTFTVYDAANGGNVTGATLTNSAAGVSNGLFTVILDFGSNVFTGGARWLEIAVRTNGNGSYTTLAPRQQLTASPYAIQSASATTAGSLAGSTLNQPLDVNVNNSRALRLDPGAGAGPNIIGGTTLNSISAGDSADFVGGGDGNQIGYPGNYSFIGGGYENSITNSGFASIVGGTGNSLGTADASGIGAGSGNQIINSQNAAVAGGALNKILQANSSAISGGSGNLVSTGGLASAVGGGSQNKIMTGGNGVIGGGGNNTITASGGATIGGGVNNTIALFEGNLNGAYATIPGGYNNYALGEYSFAAGTFAQATNFASFVWSDGNASAFDPFGSLADNEFAVRARGGVRLVTGGAGLSVDGKLVLTSGGNGSGITIQQNAEGAPNVIEGSSSNFVAGGVEGAAIGGGGGMYYGAPATNAVTANFGTVGGGGGNTASGLFSTVGGGYHNAATNTDSTVGGGYFNFANGSYSTVAGGGAYYYGNFANGDYSTIGGGADNFNYAESAVIAGGYENFTSTNAYAAAIGGGTYNWATNYQATVSGGYNNRAGGGFSTISGGSNNMAIMDYSTIGGGSANSASGASATIGGGYHNVASGALSTVAGGGAYYGGDGNVASGNYSSIGGGYYNVASGDLSTIAGGGGYYGGGGNVASGYFSSIGGGYFNTASNSYSVIPGGNHNTAGGLYSFAAGIYAQALHSGTFVWSDSSATFSPFSSTGNNQFLIRAVGGVGIGTNAPHAQLDVVSSGDITQPQFQITQTATNDFARMRLQNSSGNWDISAGPDGALRFYTVGADRMVLTFADLTVNGTFVSSSDRNVKENFKNVSAEKILEKVAALPISQWNYKQDKTSEHIGPMAQDFYAAFNVGPDDKHIAVVDESGVALAAIQGLNQKLEETRAENAELKARLEKLELLLTAKSVKGQ